MQYQMTTWSRSDSIWEGIKVNGELRAYRCCCPEDQCPSSVSFDDFDLDESDVLDFLGIKDKSDPKWARLHSATVPYSIGLDRIGL